MQAALEALNHFNKINDEKFSAIRIALKYEQHQIHKLVCGRAEDFPLA